MADVILFSNSEYNTFNQLECGDFYRSLTEMTGDLDHIQNGLRLINVVSLL